jgi:glc operon protein GlcG
MVRSQKAILALADAELLCANAIKFAVDSGSKVAVAVVDDGGHLVMLKRMDGVGPAASEVVSGKARTAATYRMPTQLLDELSRQRPGITTTGAITLEGGLPILQDGQVVGALAVGGALPEMDSRIAAQALGVLPG